MQFRASMDSISFYAHSASPPPPPGDPMSNVMAISTVYRMVISRQLKLLNPKVFQITLQLAHLSFFLFSLCQTCVHRHALP